MTKKLLFPVKLFDNIFRTFCYGLFFLKMVLHIFTLCKDGDEFWTLMLQDQFVLLMTCVCFVDFFSFNLMLLF